ncbi:MAG: nucleobase:cation symporter-2 family protein [Paracoccus sp. (in: a-proteobacteria)]|uniref:nucleobase:cation symporter-2 family protein n=1 Tax=Paracoccus sp. TaxID=267 RepID=UPI0026E0815D|nr:nucleobase:cation symporter-2 family protein [Paracoccus sp. (in: a-proteobacteria)]MDO5620309.1 nucleobase:cation symporter-2 family protein [Paracoccus sp. (in: a-proteobacteria)]
MTKTDGVDAVLPPGPLFTLGLQHVLVMYAGAVAVPLIVGRALQLDAEQVAFLISADLFVCGIVSIIQSLGAGPWFGIRLPVMMGVTFASVGPMVAIAQANPGTEGARLIFGAIIGAGIIGMLIAPLIGRMLRFFPPVVTGTIILVIGVTLMRIGINWIFGVPVGPTAPKLVDPAQAEWLVQVTALPGAPERPAGLALAASQPNPAYAAPVNIAISAAVLAVVLMVARFTRGFFSNIAVLVGIVAGCMLASVMGLMPYDKVAKAPLFELILPFHFGMPIFDPVMILTMVLVMIVVMIESTGMFLALGEMTGRRITPQMLTAGLRTDGLGTLIGGVFNTFPYTSFSQNVGLVGVTGVRSRYVCVAGGVIMLVMGLIPKIGALVESIPTAVLGGAGVVMFGMVAATGIRILSAVDFKVNRYNLFIVAISLGMGMIPLVAPDFRMWMPHAIHPLIESGILLASVSAVGLNAFFNGAAGDASQLRDAAMNSDGGH